jgi:DUF4097 and DUF4098 domain-containing protein YvlB
MTTMTPGRIAALIVGVPVALALVGWTSYTFVALAGQASMRVATPVSIYDGGVTADTGGGDVVLRQAPVTGAELTGVAHYSLFRPVLTETQTPTGASFGFRCRNVTGDCSLDATLQVPLRTRVTLSTGGGNVTVPGFGGDLTLSTQGGDVTAGSVSGDVQMQTAGGNVDADSLSGSLNLQTSGGDLDATAVSGDSMFTAGTGGGNVAVQGMADPLANITSSGGDVTLTFTQAPRNLQISTDGGNIVLFLPPGTGSAYNIQANAGGGNVTVSHAVPTSSRSSDSLILDSDGGDITVG